MSCQFSLQHIKMMLSFIFAGYFQQKDTFDDDDDEHLPDKVEQTVEH